MLVNKEEFCLTRYERLKSLDGMSFADFIVRLKRPLFE
jgi:hypothetical protein